MHFSLLCSWPMSSLEQRQYLQKNLAVVELRPAIKEGFWIVVKTFTHSSIQKFDHYTPSIQALAFQSQQKTTSIL